MNGPAQSTAASAKEGRTLKLAGQQGRKPILNVVTPQPAQPVRAYCGFRCLKDGLGTGVRWVGRPLLRARDVRSLHRTGGRAEDFYARYGVTGREIGRTANGLRPLLQNDVLNAVVGVDSMGGRSGLWARPRLLTVIYEFRGRTLEKAVGRWSGAGVAVIRFCAPLRWIDSLSL
jgi:hypothetical protein